MLMKMKIQLHYRDEKELNYRIEELKDLATLFELVLEKGALYNPEGNIFVVPLPKDVLYASVYNHAIAAFCFLKGHTYDLCYDSYPSSKF